MNALKLFLLILSFLFNFSCFSQTFTTMANGDWDNNINVWSTNGGTNPCFCSPDPNVDAFNVEIFHSVAMTDDIEVNGNGTITISTGASLAELSRKIGLKDGTITSFGSIEALELEMEADGEAYFFGSATFDAKFLIEGYLVLASNLTLLNTNMEIKSGGVIEIEDGCALDIPNGNISNEGTIQFNSACITLINGNFDNKSGGLVHGIGSITTTNGSFSNDGVWNGIQWCSSSGGSSMPFPQDCVSNPCSTILLSDDEVVWNIQQVDGHALISIELVTQNNIMLYTLEKSTNTFDFEMLATYPGMTNELQLFHFIDTDPSIFNSYYRLLKTDNNGTVKVVSLKSVPNTSYANDDLLIYPNPNNSDGHCFLNWGEIKAESALLSDLQGRSIIWKQLNPAEINNGSCSIDLSSLSSGTYTVTIFSFDGEEIAKNKLLIQH